MVLNTLIGYYRAVGRCKNPGVPILQKFSILLPLLDVYFKAFLYETLYFEIWVHLIFYTLYQMASSGRTLVDKSMHKIYVQHMYTV